MNTGNQRHYHSTIIVSACILAAAIVSGALVFSRGSSGHDQRPREESIRRQFAEQLAAALQGKQTLAGQERSVTGVNITDLRYSNRQDQILVEFSIATDPPSPVDGSCILL